MNGTLVKSRDVVERPVAMVATGSGAFLVSAGLRVVVRSTVDLRDLHHIPLDIPAACLALNSEETHMAVGTVDGKLMFFAFDPESFTGSLRMGAVQ